MWNLNNYQILFFPGIDFTDPSYHLPHFYELFALWADEEDRSFFQAAASSSREYLALTCHPITGFSAEYAEFDGTPMSRKLPWTDQRHDWFYSDAYRTVANIGLDYEWFGVDCGQRAAADRIQEFLLEACREGEYHTYEIDGRVADLSVMQQSGSADSMRNSGNSITPASIRAAATIATMLPIVCLYPFLQRYFVTGLTIGGVKE